MRLRATLLLAGALAAAGVPTLAGAAEPAGDDPLCATADSLARKGEPTAAQAEYRRLRPRPACATAGLRATDEALDRDARLCAEGAALDAAKRNDDADGRYVEALKSNVDSKCAAAGLAPKKESTGVAGVIDDVGSFLGGAPSWPPVLIGIAAGLGVVFLVGYSLLRAFKSSLVVKGFAHDAVGSDQKVGAGVAALVEQKLGETARRERRTADDDYHLDAVVADVELLAQQSDLSQAVGRMGDLPQLQVLTALLNLIDNLVRSNRLEAGGELLPPGEDGHGITVALYVRGGVRARGALWENKVADWTVEERSDGDGATGGAAPYYRLGGPAASWVQYEAARALDANVDRITTKAESFALSTAGLEFHRDGKLLEAAEAYRRALHSDPGNVAALVNLSSILGPQPDSYVTSIPLLLEARRVLEGRA